MFKKLTPIISVFISVILDTSVIPRIYCGIYLIPLTLVVVMEIAMLRGRLYGMLYGLVAGVLIDVTAGTLGMKTFAFVALGFVVGFMLDQQDIFTKMLSRYERTRQAIVRAVWIFVFSFLHECVMLAIGYFSNSVFLWTYIGHAAVRSLITIAACFLLHPMFRRIFVGKYTTVLTNRKTREVKNY